MGKSKADGFTQNGFELKWVKSVLNGSGAVCLAGLNLKTLDKG